MIRAFALCLIAGPAVAGDYALPEGCTGLATLQLNDCTVSQYYRCEGDPAGMTHRDDLTEDGLSFRSVTDAEARWVRSEDFPGPIIDRLGEETDPASLTELLDSGQDAYDFVVISSDGLRQRFTGYDRLTGVETTIDGVRLLETEFEMRALSLDGTLLWTTTGNEYVHEDWRSFISGRRTVTRDGDTFDLDERPMDFAFPGERGFLARSPIYGCGAMMSALPKDPTHG